MSDKKKNKTDKVSYVFTRETLGMTLMLFCAIVFIMLLTGDKVFWSIGRGICTFMYGTFGYGSYLIVGLLAYLGEWLVFGKKIPLTLKKAITVSATALCLFILFHAVSTRGYILNGYGAYIADCYKNAQNGYSGYTFGGVISAIFVYPIARAGGFVTVYVIFAILTLLCGYLVLLAFNPNFAFPIFRKKEIEEPVEEEETEAPAAKQPIEVEYAETPSYETFAQRKEQIEQQKELEKKQAEDDKFSDKNLGRKILFEKGEFAAESYRRNMIFNENSYFNHPVMSEADYLSSFSSNPKTDKTDEIKESYSQNYQQSVYNQPSPAMPANRVVEDDREDIDVYSNELPQYQTPAEAPQEEYYDPYGEEYDQTEYEESESAEEPAPEPPEEEPLRRYDESNFRSPREEEREEINPEPEEPSPRGGNVYDFLNGNTGRTGREDGLSTGREERSKADLFDRDDTPEETPLSRGAERITRAEPALDSRRTIRREEEKTVPPPQPVEEEKPKHVWKKYVRPTLDLLDDYPENANVNTNEIEDNKRTIVQALERYKIASEVANVTIGPSITRYDVIIEDKTNIKRSLGYRDAIAMELRKENVNAYLNYSKGAISIEVPNNRRAIVGLKTMLASPKFINSKPGSLTFALGKNVEGEVVCPDITKMPHLLVAGTTGSGKSICLSALLVSLLYKYGPEDLRLILVDPKQVEFISYDKLPHLMINEIIYDIDKAIKALNWAIKEMERRYSLFKDMTEAGVATKNLDEYNAHLKEGEEKLPKIVIVLDEFGDLMLQAKKDIESRIIKLVQKARACGIHLILATQRPSVDCITGLIKSNLPTRIGFKVNSFDDARTIFDIGGAEKLLGKGDSYFRSTDNPDLVRIQCCFVDTHEVQKVTDFVKEHNETYFDQSVSDFINTVEQEETQVSPLGDGEENAETKIDDTFIKALKYCVTSNQASVSMIQRRFPVGYIKACKIIDWMENMTYVTPSEGSKPRKVLLSKEEFLNIYGDVDD